MDLNLFDYHLPEELIAQYPSQKRGDSRLLIYDRPTDQIFHRRFADLAEYLSGEDILIYNDAKVVPARLYGEKALSKGCIEFLWLEECSLGVWRGLLRGRISLGLELLLSEGRLSARVIQKNDDGSVLIKIHPEIKAIPFLERFGKIPLPPYIKRDGQDDDSIDRERYQTIFAARSGAVAAPTAGLHFSEALIQKLEEKGVLRIPVHLRVGWGTFQKLTDQMIFEKKLHQEDFDISEENARLINDLKTQGKRIIVVGTTTARVLETCSDEQGIIHAGRGKTDLFIMPGYRFKFVKNLITNFHLPQSSLYILVSTLLGLDKTRQLYEAAIKNQYRFFSYGDAMVILG